MYIDNSNTPLAVRFFNHLRSVIRYHLSFKKRFAYLSGRPQVFGIWNVEVNGSNIGIGENVVILGGKGSVTRLTTMKIGDYEGKITVGNNTIIMAGVRISSATEIRIGNDCMLAPFCYLTDADWHDIHDRTIPVGKTAPIILEDGAWVGDSVIVCKGVRIGENSIVGAGSVVTGDIPPNVIVAGNPAREIGKLDPEKVVTMGKFMQRIGLSK